MNKFFIGLVIGLVIGGIAGYFLFGGNRMNPDKFGENDFQIDESKKQEIISFFDSTEDINEINSYCEKNRMNCLYYCKNINSNQEICDSIDIHDIPERK